MNLTTWSSTYSITTINALLTMSASEQPFPDGSPLPGGSPPPDGGPPPNGAGGNTDTLVITTLQRNLVLYGFLFLFLFRFFGHVNTILIFLRRTLRSVSTSCLFICVAISDTIYLVVCIYDFLYMGVGLSYLSQANNSNLANILCRFRSFTQSVAMCSSSWFLLEIAIDRWLRIRFPFLVKKLCTRKRALLGVMFIVVFAIALNSHLLTSSFGNLSTNICGPVVQTQYQFFYRQVWGILFACLQTVVPTVLLLIFSVAIFHRLQVQQKQKRRLNANRRRAFVDHQILIIMLTSIFLFFCTQIPFGLFNILLSPVLKSMLTQTQALELTTVFYFISSINFSTTFYIHCLTSSLFRQEFLSTIHWRKQRRVDIIKQMAEATKSQTQTGRQGYRAQQGRNQQDYHLETVF